MPGAFYALLSYENAFVSQTMNIFCCILFNDVQIQPNCGFFILDINKNNKGNNFEKKRHGFIQDLPGVTEENQGKPKS